MLLVLYGEQAIRHQPFALTGQITRPHVPHVQAALLESAQSFAEECVSPLPCGRNGRFPPIQAVLKAKRAGRMSAKRAITRVSRCMEIPCGTQPFYLLAREYVVVSSPLCGENTAFFSGFPLGGSYG